jgi:voltage-gated potassium channel
MEEAGEANMVGFFGSLWNFILASWHAYCNPRVRQPLKVIAPLITVATIFYHFVEDWTWLDAFYFSIIALSTTGFGDYSPETAAGKLFTVAYIVLGMAVLILLVREIALFSFEELSGARRSDRSSAQTNTRPEDRERPQQSPEVSDRSP